MTQQKRAAKWWTQEEVARVIRLIKQGFSRTEIEQRIGRTRSSINHKLYLEHSPYFVRAGEPEKIRNLPEEKRRAIENFFLQSKNFNGLHKCVAAFDVDYHDLKEYLTDEYGTSFPEKLHVIITAKHQKEQEQQRKQELAAKINRLLYATTARKQAKLREQERLPDGGSKSITSAVKQLRRKALQKEKKNELQRGGDTKF